MAEIRPFAGVRYRVPDPELRWDDYYLDSQDAGAALALRRTRAVEPLIKVLKKAGAI